MTSANGAASPGVVYALKDYAGTGRRLFILGIDGLVVYAVYVLLVMAAESDVLGSVGPYASILGFPLFCYLYLAMLARSRFGTLGYAVASVRVVDLTGGRPSLACMSLRTGFMVIGPLNALLDLLWVAGDPNRQALRDKLPGTYVIRKGASPAQTGLQKPVLIWFLGYSFIVEGGSLR